MPVEYHLDHLDPVAFQRLINALLTARYGETIRILPLRGADGGRDAESAPGAPSLEFILETTPVFPGLRLPSKPGRYLFQFKHHRTTDKPIAVVRSVVVSDFQEELLSNVLSRSPEDAVDYFFLVTNVPGSKDAVARADEKRRDLLGSTPTTLHADILWQEHVVSWLDQLPRIWLAFPELFAGMQVPMLAQVAVEAQQGLPRAMRLALSAQFSRDSVVRFRQTNLQHSIAKLFVDLDALSPGLTLVDGTQISEIGYVDMQGEVYWYNDHGVSCIGLLAAEVPDKWRRLILRGGPGQGKSTVTQMLAQLYRALFLQRTADYAHLLLPAIKARFPLRLELRLFAEWLGANEGSVEQFIAQMFSRDAGGASVTVEQIHALVENSPVTLIFDGLDEVGSDQQRDLVVAKIIEVVDRFEKDLKCDLRVIVTSRPPAIAGRASALVGFISADILPLTKTRIDQYTSRWVGVQCQDSIERERVLSSFEKRRAEVHVGALAKNPMQLSVLLHLIRLKGEAFPDRRAELYREYFKTVIDRDVEKSPKLLRSRDDIEAIHELLGFEIHSRSEGDAAKSSLTRQQLLATIRDWLSTQNRKVEIADELFVIGEERLGLIVALRGEGAATHYGFEVQPVREYFAAAFINDKCEGDAHEIFQAMVRRTFWREVALFLAGLRRANEKADLLSRCRALDDDPEHGWRQDGRAIVLQLLQEGVLTSPGHVYQEAVAFLLESLDPTDSHPRNEPAQLTALLPKVIAGCDNPQHLRILEVLLSKASRSTDRAAVQRLYAVANKTLSIDALRRQLGDYTGTNAKLAADVKLGWPARDGVDLETVIEASGVLRSGANAELASAWFASVFGAPALTGIPLNGAYHELLFEQFAFTGIQLYPRLQADIIHPIRPYAIWALCATLRRICEVLIGTATPPSPALDDRSVDYEHLPEAMAGPIRELIESSSEVVKALDLKRPLTRVISPFLRVIERALSCDGLAGWIACRCATTLIEFAERPPLFDFAQRHLRFERQPHNLRRLKAWAEMRRFLPAFFRSEIHTDLDRSGRTLASRIAQLGLYNAAPSHVRVNGRFESVPRMLIYTGQSRADLPWQWLKRIPVPQHWWSDIVRGDDALLEAGLKTMGDQTATRVGPPASINLVNMRRLLRLVRLSTERKVYAVGLAALLDSRFINITGTKTALRMICADGEGADLAADLFALSHGDRDSLTVRKTQLASMIVRREVSVSLSTAIAAARYLAQNLKANLSPLKTLPCLDGVQPKANT